ncbi:MAG: hypothetical protein A2Z70_01355 [Chloroflexi bacterium RBG_13_48_17]|nr:MAG: hypothetical protein A2Z70_01355 [Chloroflexi bacterium RBG_13_48_17]
MRNILRSLVGISLVISVISALPAIPALALDEPDTVSLDDILLFQDLLVDGDILAVVPYEISFGASPDENADQTFIFLALSPDGATVNGTALAYPAYDGGYGNGVVAFYWATGMTWEANYIFRVQENPTYYPSPAYWDFPVNVSNYSSDSDQADALRNKIIDSATYLSTTFGVALTETSESGSRVLSAYGEIYYLSVIPGLQSMAPALFAVQLEDPDYSRRSWSLSLAESLKTKYEDTLLYDFMTGYAGLFSTETSSTMTFFALFLSVAVMLISIWKFKASMLSAFDDAYTLLLCLMLLGIFDMVLAGTLAFTSTAIGGVILFLNKD